MPVLVEVTDEGAVDLRFSTVTNQSANQYTAQILTAAHTCAIAGANGRAIGILQNAPNGTAANPVTAVVRVSGVSRLRVAEACRTGRLITPTAAGLGEEVDADNEPYFAQSLDFAGGVANDQIAVVLTKGRAGGADDA